MGEYNPLTLQSLLSISKKLQTDSDAIELASKDYGNIIRKTPFAVLNPSTISDIQTLIKLSFTSSIPFTISARGCGHSLRGQAMAENGVVVNMQSLSTTNQPNGSRIIVSGNCFSGFYADVGGEQMWIDVLKETLQYGVSPVSWTDYLYLTVGGTLSNGGISGQTFRYGPQITNVYELDVLTGKGELVKCSENENSDLFHGVLGGLGQFGIITRARIALEPAPKRVKWMRLLYNDFSLFTRDQVFLISKKGRKDKNALDYLEGLLLMQKDCPHDSWRSSFFPLSDYSKITSLVSKHGIIYCLELAKYYDHHNQTTVDTELEVMLKGLKYSPEFKYEQDVSYVDFLNRVRNGELELQSQGLWDVPHPWLNLFVPKSSISDFNSAVFHNILNQNFLAGPILIYPMLRSKWNDKMSAVIPDEEIFYNVGLLQSSGFNDWKKFDDQNQEILKFCENSGIKVKQYLPQYTSKSDWKNHFGSKWKLFQDRKSQFDPKMILSPGQKIFIDM